MSSTGVDGADLADKSTGHTECTVPVRGTNNAAPIAFALRFIVYFAALLLAFEASRGTAFERFVVEDMILAPTKNLINAIRPAEHVTLVGRKLASPRSTLNVTRGCEGIEMFLLLVAGIAAFPAGAKQRLIGLVAGSALAYALSVARLVGLHFVLSYSPGGWEALHGLVMPMAPIIVMAIFFLRWSGQSAPGAGIHADAGPH